MSNTILTDKEVELIAIEVAKKAKNYINVNQHIFQTIVTHVLKSSLEYIETEGRKEK
jgi:hypothetical protein